MLSCSAVRRLPRGLGVPGRGVDALVREVEVQGGEAVRGGGILEGLASVPHHRAQEAEVGGGQRPPEERELLRVANPYGSSTPTSSNSAFAGIPMPTLISARSSRSPKASRRAATVDTSASGEVAPSTVRNRGSRPSVRGEPLPDDLRGDGHSRLGHVTGAAGAAVLPQ